MAVQNNTIRLADIDITHPDINNNFRITIMAHQNAVGQASVVHNVLNAVNHNGRHRLSNTNNIALPLNICTVIFESQSTDAPTGAVTLYY